MRTLHVGLRVADPDRSLAFYEALGYEVVGRVAGTPLGDLAMLKLPDDEFVAIELVHRPAGPAPGPDRHLSHLVIQVASLEAMLAGLARRGIVPGAPVPAARPGDTAWIVDPDGNRIELVQWPVTLRA